MKAYKFKINGKEYNVAVNGIEGKNADVTVNGVNYQVELETEVSPALAASAQAPASVSGPQAIPLEGAQGVKTTAGNAVGGKKIESPLPGVIISVDVKEGQAVKRGQKLAVIEAMKMENEILSDVDGTVTAIHVKQGDSVLEGADIVTIA